MSTIDAACAVRLFARKWKEEHETFHAVFPDFERPSIKSLIKLSADTFKHATFLKSASIGLGWFTETPETRSDGGNMVRVHQGSVLYRRFSSHWWIPPGICYSLTRYSLRHWQGRNRGTTSADEKFDCRNMAWGRSSTWYSSNGHSCECWWTIAKVASFKYLESYQ